MKKRAIILGLAVIIAISCAASFFYFKNRNVAAIGIPVDAVTVSRKTIEGSVTTKGSVQLSKMETIASEAQAKILSVNVKEGDEIRQGDILIEYDPKSKEKLEESLVEAELALRSAELSLSGASLPSSSREIANAETEVVLREKSIEDAKIAIERADITFQGILDNLETARNDYRKKQALFEAGAISKAELDLSSGRVSELELSLQNSRMSKETLSIELATAMKSRDAAEQALMFIKNRTGEPSVQNQIALAEVNVEQQKLRITQIKKQIEEFKLVEVSPINGSVINVFVENGYVTQAGDRLIYLGNTNELIIVTEVVEYDVPSVSIGQQVELTGEALRSDKLMGEVVSIAPSATAKQIGNTTGNVVKTEIRLLDVNSVLRPGFSVTARILTEKYDNAITVPLLSLVYDKEGEYSVFIIKNDNTVEKRSVVVLNFAALDAVVEGVSEGERIVASPPLDLEEGALVRLDD